MTDLSEDDPREPAIPPAGQDAVPATAEESPLAGEQPVELPSAMPTPVEPAAVQPSLVPSAPPAAEPPLFQSFAQPEPRPPARIPHLGHLLLLFMLGSIGFVCAVVLLFLAMRFHLFGWDLSTKSAMDIRLVLSSEGILYLATFGIGLAVFPQIWNKGFFAGIQWRGSVALRRFWPLAGTAAGCLALAILDEAVMPGPSSSPIEKMMRSPGAAWLMFGFGITLAPFFEEMFFRGFLLPSLCTAVDWVVERTDRRPAPPLDPNGHPQWSLLAMVVASLLTSLPFALLHVEQQGHSIGPFLLLIVVSLILCTVRLVTRSLAASTLVHSCYNFLIFMLAMIGTGGFRHFDKM
ncbi:MAG: CPBP family glutamic-type intramembrane protease [Terracidiphilus sp.]|jgi:hypothetical protein